MVRCQDESGLHERIDRSFDLLGSACRRRVIYALRADGPATVEELADAVVAAGVADERERIVASLTHAHLPKLDEFDVVEYAGPDAPVTLADGVELLEPFLRIAARRETNRDPNPAAGPAPDAVAGTSPD